MQKLTRPLTVVVFALLSLLPLALFTVDGPWPWPGSGSIKLQSRTAFPSRMTPYVFREVDRWFISRVGLRVPMLAIGAAYHVGLFRRSTDRRIVLGRDGWLFLTEGGKVASMADYRGWLRFTDTEVKTINRRLLAIHNALAACGIQSLIVVAPDKQTIYGEYLDKWDAPPKTRLDDLLSRLDPQVRNSILDLHAPLREGKTHDHPSLPLYYKTDTHWNELGAFYAYKAILDRLAETTPIPNLQIASLNQFTIESHPYDSGDIAVNMLSAREWFSDVQIRLQRKANTEKIAKAAAGSMLLIGDSFSSGLRAYFPPHFAEFRSGTYGDLFAEGKRGDIGKPSIMVIEIVERNVPDIMGWTFDLTKFCHAQ